MKYNAGYYINSNAHFQHPKGVPGTHHIDVINMVDGVLFAVLFLGCQCGGQRHYSSLIQLVCLVGKLADGFLTQGMDVEN